MRPLLLLPLLAGFPVSAASLLTLSNPVADGSITVTASNNVRSDWNGVTAYPADADESLATDFLAISMAHDSQNLYLRQQFHRTANSGFFASNQILFFDTDQDRSTGYTGPTGSLAIGAEFLLEGTSLFAFTGDPNQSAFSWNFLGSITFDDFPLNDHEMGFSLALLGGGVDAFDFVGITDYFGNGDHYPDSAYSATGGYYTYTIIPEPAAGAFLLAALGAAVFHRRRR